MMMSEASKNTLEPAVVADVASLVNVAPSAIVSRVVARAQSGSVTVFAFAAGQELSEHTAPFDALVHVFDGKLAVTIGGESVEVGPSQMVLMPANVPHALRADADSRMILTMLKE
jgi:quercetin dioxygenase-like cupin family protein